MMANRVLLIVVGTAIAVRFVFVALFPFGGGDWAIYSTVAENILRGCGVSLSRISSGECIPHFGGNHLPGYPAFVAVVWKIFAHSDTAVRIAQLILYVLALGRLVVVVRRYTGSETTAMVVGLVMALSPLQVAWPRYTQTETLTLAAVIWLYAEILASFAEGRLRAVPVAVAIVGATFIRMDGILLCIPVAIASFMLHRPLAAIQRGALAAIIVAVPIAGWTMRNVAVGVSVVPAPLVLPNNAPAPYGYVKWGGTWVNEEYQRMGWAWPVTRFQYDSIAIDDKAFDSEAERDRVRGWLTELAGYTGKPFPLHIDARFAKLAQEREARAPLRNYVILPAQRAMALWKNPLSSFGWPVELRSVGNQDRLEASRNAEGLLGLAREYPVQAIIKASIAGYRFALLAAFAAVLVLSFGSRLSPYRHIIWIVTAWVAARTALLAFTNNIETRYTAPTTPGIELVVVLSVLALLVRDQYSGRGHIGSHPQASSAS